MKKRTMIRLCSFSACFIIVLAAFAITGTVKSNRYQIMLERIYQQNLTELSESLDSIETNLTKSEYAASGNILNSLSSDINSECNTAKIALSSLPVDQLKLSGTYKFLSQAADYTRYLSQKESISEKDYETISQLLKYAKSYSGHIDNMVNRCMQGSMITEYEVQLEGTDEKAASISVDFTSAEESFADYPTLLYDGPFADAVLNKEASAIKDKQEISKDKAAEIAANALGTSKKSLAYKAEEDGSLPAYIFSYKLSTIAVTKRGGYISYIMTNGNIKSQSITEENAKNLAEDFLKKAGYSDMQASYSASYNNICVINFVYSKNGIIYYPDLIKVGISLSDGSVYSLEASGFLTNHTERTLEMPHHNEQEIRSNLPGSLEIISARACVIPKKDGTEKLCFEYHCKSNKNNEEALIYYNAETNWQEDILILLYSDNGTLTK